MQVQIPPLSGGHPLHMFPSLSDPRSDEGIHLYQVWSMSLDGSLELPEGWTLGVGFGLDGFPVLLASGPESKNPDPFRQGWLYIRQQRVYITFHDSPYFYSNAMRSRIPIRLDEIDGPTLVGWSEFENIGYRSSRPGAYTRTS